MIELSVMIGFKGWWSPMEFDPARLLLSLVTISLIRLETVLIRCSMWSMISLFAVMLAAVVSATVEFAAWMLGRMSGNCVATDSIEVSCACIRATFDRMRLTVPCICRIMAPSTYLLLVCKSEKVPYRKE